VRRASEVPARVINANAGKQGAMPRGRTARSPARQQKLSTNAVIRSQAEPLSVTSIGRPNPRTLYALGLGNSLACGTEDIDIGSEVPWHLHEESEEMLFCVSGKGRIFVGEESASFIPGVMALVPCRIQHRITNESTDEVLHLAWALSPPQAPQQFRAAGGAVIGASATDDDSIERYEPAIARRFRWLFPKLSDPAAYARALPAVRELYYGGAPPTGGASGGVRARAAGRVLHVTYHTLPHNGTARALRLLALSALLGLWAWLVPLAGMLKGSLVALIYTFTEYGFTRFVERGRGYTSLAQAIANVLYAPLLLDGYRYAIDKLVRASATAAPLAAAAHAPVYVALFPLNIWLYEALLGHALVWLYGHNVAYCYDDYADAFCAGCCRFGHGVFWLGLGAAVLMVEAPVDAVANAAAAAVAAMVG
jgi:mannose-6-phosphate isomerase-like protein (cupin superfamily)